MAAETAKILPIRRAKMKIKFHEHLMGFNNKPLVDEQLDEEGKVIRKPLELSAACINPLLASKGEDTLPGEKKLQRFNLACRIHNAASRQEELDVSVEEVALLKELIGKAYPPMITGPAWILLERGAQ
jgi:hypothetical protein